MKSIKCLLSLIILQVIVGTHYCRILKSTGVRTINEPKVCKSEIMALKDDLGKEKFVIPKKQDSIKGKLTDLSASFQKSIKKCVECLKKNQKNSKRRKFFQRISFQPNDDPYAPTFYVNENLIGYTGNYYQSPSIYYLSDIFAGEIYGNPLDLWVMGYYSLHGRITQAHNNINNVGRNEVRRARLYFIRNIIKGEKVVSREFDLDYKDEFYGLHTSRTPYTPLFYGAQEVGALTQVTNNGNLRRIKPKHLNP